MIGWLLGPLFRWFAYRCEVRLWMDGDYCDRLEWEQIEEADDPTPFEMVKQ
jgi:hypothetical protein